MNKTGTTKNLKNNTIRYKYLVLFFSYTYMGMGYLY